ncbi:MULTISPECIES: hypothetical protein [Bacillus]|uniref:hypothetical protein n=1 Tax=Bacillus TaxID=1386 RepID=UPI00089310F7|nr:MULTISPECIES: hypothetical protein [Bacillus cereus group]MCU5182644.1 hypothetical protein [Bacillus toyonensis]OFD00086.1 hypothetical protein BTGOE7_58280 [Bacillus thuringiensis]
MFKVQSNITSFGEERWMILHNNSEPIIPVMKFIKHKDSLGKASNTLKTYFYHLKIFWCFQNEKNKDYTEVDLSLLTEFIHWLRKPTNDMNIIYLNETKKLAYNKKLNTFATTQNILKKMYLFFDFIVENYSKWIDLQNLQRQDIEDFLFYVRNREMGRKSYTKNRVPSNRHVIECLSNVRRIIEYM